MVINRCLECKVDTSVNSCTRQLRMTIAFNCSKTNYFSLNYFYYFPKGALANPNNFKTKSLSLNTKNVCGRKGLRDRILNSCSDHKPCPSIVIITTAAMFTIILVAKPPFLRKESASSVPRCVSRLQFASICL